MYFCKVILEDTWMYLFNLNSFSCYFNILNFYNDKLFNFWSKKNKFELIWSYIWKDMIFPIFRNFLEFFWIYLTVFFIWKWLKRIKMGLYYLALKWRSAATWGRAHVCPCDTWTLVCTCVHDVCAWHACVCVTRERNYKWVRSICNRI